MYFKALIRVDCNDIGCNDEFMYMYIYIFEIKFLHLHSYNEILDCNDLSILFVFA